MTTFDRLRDILARDYPLDAAALRPETPLDSLGIDSLGVAELLFTVEDEFQIQVPSQPVALATMGDVVEFIDARLSAAADPPPAG